MRRQNLYLTRVEAETFLHWRRACQVKMSFLQLFWQLQCNFTNPGKCNQSSLETLILLSIWRERKVYLWLLQFYLPPLLCKVPPSWNMHSGWHHKIISTPSKQTICTCSSLALVLDTVPHIFHVVLMVWRSAVLSWPSAICFLKDSPLLPLTCRLSTFC